MARMGRILTGCRGYGQPVKPSKKRGLTQQLSAGVDDTSLPIYRWFWCIKGTQSEETHQFDVRIDHGVSA
jgi:hypothetical protein